MEKIDQSMATDSEKQMADAPSTEAKNNHVEVSRAEKRDSTCPDPTILKHSRHVDEAMKAFADTDGEPLVLSEETNKRLLKKIDWHLIPIMCIIYGLNYLDSMYCMPAATVAFCLFANS